MRKSCVMGCQSAPAGGAGHSVACRWSTRATDRGRRRGLSTVAGEQVRARARTQMRVRPRPGWCVGRFMGRSCPRESVSTSAALLEPCGRTQSRRQKRARGARPGGSGRNSACRAEQRCVNGGARCGAKAPGGVRRVRRPSLRRAAVRSGVLRGVRSSAGRVAVSPAPAATRGGVRRVRLRSAHGGRRDGASVRLARGGVRARGGERQARPTPHPPVQVAKRRCSGVERPGPARPRLRAPNAAVAAAALRVGGNRRGIGGRGAARGAGRWAIRCFRAATGRKSSSESAAGGSGARAALAPSRAGPSPPAGCEPL